MLSTKMGGKGGGKTQTRVRKGGKGTGVGEFFSKEIMVEMSNALLGPMVSRFVWGKTRKPKKKEMVLGKIVFFGGGEMVVIKNRKTEYQ